MQEFTQSGGVRSFVVSLLVVGYDDKGPQLYQVVASMDWPQVIKYKALVSTQPHRQEIIQDLYHKNGAYHGGLIRSNAEDAIQNMHDTVIGKQTVRVSWGKTPARRHVNLSIAILPMSKEFNWNSATVGLIQSSFFWGYLLTQLSSTQRLAVNVFFQILIVASGS